MLRSHNTRLDKLAYPTLKEAVWYWLTLGFMSFGGPAGQIAMMHDDLVEQKRWISNKRFLHALNFCMVLPGPEAQQLAIYLGWLLHRTKGGIIAGLLFITPAFFILVILAYIYLVFGQQPIIAAVFSTIKPAVIAIVFFAAWRMGKRALSNTFFIGIATIAFFAITVFKVAFPWLMLTVAMLGLIAVRVKPSLLDSANDSEHHLVQGKKSDIKTSGNALVDADQNTQALNIKSKTYYVIDDDTPLPMYARFNKRYFVTLLLAGLALWVGVMLLLVMLVGWQGMYTQMAWFFTKAALLTFGGAYAVLPYVYQGAVDYYHWLTPLQMMDGLALGETTPGPLIMVVTFVGFLGGWGNAQYGVDSPLLLGLVAAFTVTFFTFLPSFMMILLSAPLVEKTQHNQRVVAPLKTISAAVVGVIVSLGVMFALHVLLPFGYAFNTLLLDVDWLALLLSVLGLFALIKLKIKISHLLLLYMLLGLVRHFV